MLTRTAWSRCLLRLDVPHERPQLLLPVRLDLVEPGLYGDDGLLAQPEDPQPGVVRHSLVDDQPGGQQDPQVPAHRRRRRPGRGSKLSRSPRPLPQQPHHLPPGRISQYLEEAINLIVHHALIVTSVVNY